MSSDRIDLPWWKFHRGDYLRTTLGWPPIARLAYVELLGAQWDAGALPVESDDVRVLVAGVSAGEWSVAWPYLEREFPIAGDVRLNLVLDRQREKQAAIRKSRSSVARKAAKERWRERTGVDADDA